MLEKLVDSSPLLAVYFFDEECTDCPEVLAALETIDTELDVFGIDFVKVNDALAFDKWSVHTVPQLAFFRKKEPIFYDGDLTDGVKVLAWLTSDDLFEVKDEIEEVNRKMLDKLLNENDYIAVYFCKYMCSDAALRLCKHSSSHVETYCLLQLKNNYTYTKYTLLKLIC